jgi:hypothetical protein
MNSDTPGKMPHQRFDEPVPDLFKQADFSAALDKTKGSRVAQEKSDLEGFVAGFVTTF